MSSTSSNEGLAITDILTQWAERFEQTLSDFITPDERVPASLSEAMRYSVLGGGKRVRAFIITRICESCGGTAEEAAPAAVALECVHAFSLVHDDLPAMDDDDLRRGRPTCHKAYGEAAAILAGDGLLALAFEILGKRVSDPSRAVAMVAELADGTGWAGMIGGQTSDILGEDQAVELALVERIHRYKTARLFACAGKLGALAAGGTEQQIEAARTFGEKLGLAFQIADDLLDVTGNQADMGKAVAKDADAGKQTYPAAVGIEASRRKANELMQEAIQALSCFSDSADELRALAKFVVERQN